MNDFNKDTTNKQIIRKSDLKTGIAERVNFYHKIIGVKNQKAFNKIKGYIDRAKDNPNSEIIIGGNCDDTNGWFIEPTIILTSDPKSETMVEEIFGPVLTGGDDNCMFSLPFQIARDSWGENTLLIVNPTGLLAPGIFRDAFDYD